MGAVVVPVERPLDPIRLDPVPPFAEPQVRVAIAAVGDELPPFAIGDAAVGDGVRAEQGAVPRPLAIEGEAVARRANLDYPFAAGQPRQWLGRMTGRGGAFAISRLERIFGEGREDVGQEQFLVLLLVLDADRDQRQRRLGQVRQRRLHRVVDRARASRESRRGSAG